MDLTLSSREKKLLGAILFGPNLPMRSIQSATGLRAHVIRYILRGLLERGVLRPGPIIDVHPLGFSQYGIFFSVAHRKQQIMTEFHDTLLKSDEVSFLAEIGGDYQYALSICAHGLLPVSRFFDRLSRKFGDIFVDKATTTRIGLLDFENRALLSITGKRKAFHWGASEQRVSIDELDHNILVTLSQGIITHAEVARALDESASTVGFRIRRLQSMGILLGLRYWIDSEKFGFSAFLILLTLKRLDEGLRKKIHRFSHNNPNVTFTVENFGMWDYELGLEVPNSKDMVSIVQELHSAIGPQISQLRTLPVYRYVKVKNYPFKQYRA